MTKACRATPKKALMRCLLYNLYNTFLFFTVAEILKVSVSMETNLKVVLKFHLLISLLCFPMCLVCLSVYLVVVYNIVCALTVQNDGRCISRIICSREFYIHLKILFSVQTVACTTVLAMAPFSTFRLSWLLIWWACFAFCVDENDPMCVYMCMHACPHTCRYSYNFIDVLVDVVIPGYCHTCVFSPFVHLLRTSCICN